MQQAAIRRRREAIVKRAKRLRVKKNAIGVKMGSK